MKYLLSALIAVTMSLASVRADTAPAPRIIQVSGSASVTTEPDRMKWNLELITSGNDAEQVTREHSGLLQDTLKYLDTLGLKKDAVRASQLRINDETSYVESKLRQKDIVARVNVQFTTDALDKYRDIWIGLGKLKGVRISHVEMDTSRRIELEKEARTKALQAGKKKAEEMATVLGVAVKEPLAIRESGMQAYGESRVAFKSMAAGGGAEPLPGSIEISDTVDLTFRIE